MKGQAKGTCRLKGADTLTFMGDNSVSLRWEEHTCGGKGTMVIVQRGIVEVLLLVRKSREGGDLEDQRNDVEGSNFRVTPFHLST
jgi:hypothetical protein